VPCSTVDDDDVDRFAANHTRCSSHCGFCNNLTTEVLMGPSITASTVRTERTSDTCGRAFKQDSRPRPPTTTDTQLTFLLRPGRERSTATSSSVCLSVCLSVRGHISGTARPIFTKFSVQIPCGRGSVLFWQRCDTLCTSGLWTTSRLAVVGRMAMRAKLNF